MSRRELWPFGSRRLYESPSRHQLSSYPYGLKMSISDWSDGERKQSKYWSLPLWNHVGLRISLETSSKSNSLETSFLLKTCLFWKQVFLKKQQIDHENTPARKHRRRLWVATTQLQNNKPCIHISLGTPDKASRKNFFLKRLSNNQASTCGARPCEVHRAVVLRKKP